MRDVAKAAGVSVMTVSYALRGHSRISRETTERVVAVAREMGYQPHPLVSAMVRQIQANREVTAAPVIAYVVSYSSRTRWQRGVPWQFYEGAAARCRQLGFGFELFELSNYGMSAKRMSQVMRYRNICGLVVAPVSIAGRTLDLDWEHFPNVAIGYSMPSPSVHRVAVNYLQSIQLVMERLSAIGYQRIATVIDVLESGKRGGEIFAAGVNVFHRSIPAARRVPIIYKWPGNGREFWRWISKHKVDAVVARSALFNNFFHEEISGRPDGEIGFATLSWKADKPEIAGLNQNAFEVGRAAVSTLVQQIYSNERGIPPLQTFTLVNGSWMDGPSAPGRLLR